MEGRFVHTPTVEVPQQLFNLAALNMVFAAHVGVFFGRRRRARMFLNKG